MSETTLILGAGMTGLAAGMVSGLPVFEATNASGGICSSYYMTADSPVPVDDPDLLPAAYRFEIGGGHWIFGGDPLLIAFIESLVSVRRYERRSSVYFPDTRQFVPYPIQNNLRHLDPQLAARSVIEMAAPKVPSATMADWNTAQFGQTLSELFFTPFHDLYTAGLHHQIAPQDGYKSPIDMTQVVRGAFAEQEEAVGYNTTFLYPEHGLNSLASAMAERCNLKLDHRVTSVHVQRREVTFSNGERVRYGKLISTLPLNTMLSLSAVTTEARVDPHNGVLVLNIGAVKGSRCPDDHWLYVPRSHSGFHRVGFYSNVDRSFLPERTADGAERVSIYVERAHLKQPGAAETERYAREVVQELQRWGFIREAEVVHPTWIDVAYTWSRPGSNWATEAVSRLQAQGIYQIGRYARWHFQGIADSIRDGFVAGASFANHTEYK